MSKRYNLVTCSAGGILVLSLLLFGSRLAQADSGQDDSNRTMTIEVKKTITFEARVGGCEANLALEYWQKGDQADVEMVLNNAECPASSGEFTIQVRYRTEDGELVTDEYPEEWSRDDDQPIEMSRLYPIGDGVDLIRVRSRRLSCTCTAPTPAP